MVLNIILIALIVGVAYFHYEQGLLAATVSAFCAAVAALMAFSFHETVVTAVMGGRLAAYADGMMLCLLFVIVYSLLRTVTDNMIAGNARYPGLMDKIGAGVMGLAAAFFPAAVVAIAAQELPFGPSVMMYSPLPVQDTQLRVDNNLSRDFKVERGDDVTAFDQLRVASLTGDRVQEQRQSLWLPVDEWFLGLVAQLSDGGSIAGKSDFRDVYPDFKIAAFADRLGMQRASTQVALNLGDKDQVSVPALFAPTFGPDGQFPAEGIPQVDGDIRGSESGGEGRTVASDLKPAAGKRMVVVRVAFNSGDMADRGGLVRFSPATSRLVAGGKEFFPVGTLESATIAVAHLPDDHLLSERGADLIYQLDDDVVSGDALVDGAFLEFKRFGRVALVDKPLGSPVTKNADTFVLRKIPVKQLISDKLAGETSAGFNRAEQFDALRASVPAGSGGGDAAAAEPESGGGGGPMGVIRGAAEERNRAIEGE